MKTKNRLKLLLLLPFATQLCYAQMATAPSYPTGNDYFLSVPTTTYQHLGHLQTGTWRDGDGTWCELGLTLSDATYTVPPQANDSSLYGLTIQHLADRTFFGSRRLAYNRCDGLIAWGDDDTLNGGSDRLVFEFHDSNAGNGTVIKRAMTMMPYGTNGVYTGIGTYQPTEQLHTTAGVKFEGLTTGGSPNNVVSIDGNGKLWRSAMTGIQNLCATTNFVPKTVSGGTLNCSQIYDDGTSVGIASTGSFGYSWPGGLSGTTAPPSTGTLKLDVNGVTRALAYFATSDRRYKRNINPLSNALATLQKLQGVSYLWNKAEYPNMNFNDVGQLGFIAQDVEKVLPEAIIKDEQGYYSMNYITLIPLLTEGIKEQQAMIETLKKQVDELTQSKATGVNQPPASQSNPSYFTIQPNPFSESTELKYTLPSNSGEAMCLVYDLQGKILKKLSLPQGVASGSVMLAKDNLSAGVYYISLTVNNKELQTEKVILAD